MTSPRPHPNGKTALVTGGAIRVGRAVALRLAEVGYDVAITCRTSRAEADQLVAQIQAMGRRAFAIEVDMADDGAAEAVRDAVAKRLGRLDALVNNASCFAPEPIGRITRESLEKNMAVNAFGPLLLIQALTPMLAEGADPQQPESLGRVVNFIDIHVIGQPLKGYLPYNMSKAALQELTMSAAVELAPRITVNAIAPGVVAWADSYTEQMKRDYMQRVPLARPGSPEDAAAAVLYLVRDAHYCTGQIIKLDGGRLIT